MHVAAVSLLLLSAGAVWAQGPNQLEFEVATVKPANPDAPVRPPQSGGPGTSAPGIISYHQSLKRLFMQAYGMRANQVICPDWMVSTSFDIVAKVPEGAIAEGARAEDMNGLLGKLLVERFQVKLHRERRDFAAYAMTVAKGGLKMKPTEYPNASPEIPSRIPFTLDKNDFPVLPKELNVQLRVSWIKNGSFRETFRAFTMARLAEAVAQALPVIITAQMEPMAERVEDRTGVQGMFDFTLEYQGRSDDSSGPALPGALEKQLGLHLEKITLPDDVIVIDRIEKKPIEN